MSKILDAVCEDEVVEVGGFEITNPVILSKGIGPSSGVLLVDGDKKTYLTSNATDIEAAILKINDAITKIGTVLTSIGAGMTGPTTAPPPTLVADVAEINGFVTDLVQIKENLK